MRRNHANTAHAANASDSGGIVSFVAAAAPVSIAKLIQDQGADYVLAVNGNV